MYRSFENRILGGVCGGIAETTRLNVWLLRLILIVLTIITLGFGLLVYLAVWWAIPQRGLTLHQRGNLFNLLITLLIIGGMGALWVSRDMTWMRASNGEALFLPVALLVMSGLFLLRQVRA